MKKVASLAVMVIPCARWGRPQVPPQIGGIERAAQARVLFREPADHASAAQSKEAVQRRARLALEYGPHGLPERWVVGQGGQDAAQMIAEDPVVGGGARFEGGEVNLVRRHLVQSPPDQVRMPAQQVVEAADLGLVFQARP